METLSLKCGSGRSMEELPQLYKRRKQTLPNGNLPPQQRSSNIAQIKTPKVRSFIFDFFFLIEEVTETIQNVFF